MQDFIQMAMAQLGTNEETTRSATAGLLNMVKDAAPQGDFQQLLAKVPGAEGLLQQAAPSAGGSLLGGLAGKAAGMLGGNLGAAAGALAMLQKAGLDAGAAGTFVSLLTNYLKDKAGAELVGRLVGNVSGLQQFLK